MREILEFAFVCDMCVHSRELIVNYPKLTCHNWLSKFTAFQFACMTLAVDKIDGHGLINKVLNVK